jgi:hypothetical protein
MPGVDLKRHLTAKFGGCNTHTLDTKLTSSYEKRINKKNILSRQDETGTMARQMHGETALPRWKWLGTVTLAPTCTTLVDFHTTGRQTSAQQNNKKQQTTTTKTVLTHTCSHCVSKK